MNKLKYILIFAISALITSCDPQSIHTMVVTNKSSHELSISPGNHIVKPNSSVEIYRYVGLGGPGSSGDCKNDLLIGKLEVTIPSHSELKVTKDLNSTTVWSFSK